MNHKSILRFLTVAATALCVCWTSTSTQAAPQSQDTGGVIDTFDVLGVKLGMPEPQAVAAIRARYPNVKSADIKLGNPGVRSGVRFDLRPNPLGTNYDFIKLYVSEGRVWAIWRDDLSASYPYERTIDELRQKYPQAAPMMSEYDVVVGNRRTAGNGKVAHGFELYSGNCAGDDPIRRVNSSDFIRLEGACSKFFVVRYGVLESGGVKALVSGTSLLVDLDRGRAFLADLNRGTVRQTAPAKL